MMINWTKNEWPGKVEDKEKSDVGVVLAIGTSDWRIPQGGKRDRQATGRWCPICHRLQYAVFLS